MSLHVLHSNSLTLPHNEGHAKYLSETKQVFYHSDVVTNVRSRFLSLALSVSSLSEFFMLKWQLNETPSQGSEMSETDSLGVLSCRYSVRGESLPVPLTSTK